MSVKSPSTDPGKDLFSQLTSLVSEGKSANKVKKAKRLIAELETGYANEAAFVSGARKLLGIEVPADDD